MKDAAEARLEAGWMKDAAEEEEEAAAAAAARG